MDHRTLILVVMLFAVLAGCSQSENITGKDNLSLAKSSCISNYGRWDEKAESCISAPTNESDCNKEEGVWHNANTEKGIEKSLPSKITQSYCELPATDTGKTCKDKSECDKYCKPICTNGAEDCALNEMNKEYGECAKFFDLYGGYSWNDGEVVEWRTY
ncbi:MAG: hypothetical protein HYT75_00925 [Deltaproteobacteria bacterium]|nr:hypothetical protein [Deltaproteobacteria bacterium]